MFYAVFSSSNKDAKPLTGTRVLRGMNFIQPDGVK